MSDRIELPRERKLGIQDRRAIRSQLIAELEARPSRRRLRMPRLTPARAAGVVGLATAVIAAILALGPSGDGGSGANPILERAYAALSKPNTIWHFRVRTTTRETPRTSDVFLMEAWFTSDGRSRVLAKSYATPPRRDTPPMETETVTHGKVSKQYVKTRGVEILQTDLPKDSSLASFGSLLDKGADPRQTIRALIEEEPGPSASERTVAYRGRSVEELTYTVPETQGGPARRVFLFDSKTHYPVAFRTYFDQGSQFASPGLDGAPDIVSSFSAFESFPLNARTERFLQMGRHPRARVCRRCGLQELSESESGAGGPKR